VTESQSRWRHKTRRDLAAKVAARERRKLKSRAEKLQSVWFGLGMFGMIGWAVAVPTLIGTAVGLWIDSRWETPYSWTLMLLLTGVGLGCLNAWYWVQKESRDPEEEDRDSRTPREP
jgi:ATP synthase protein I